MVNKHAYLNTLLLLHSTFMLCVVKMALKGEAGGCALNSHGNYIVDGKIMELCFVISVGTLVFEKALLSLLFTWDIYNP